MSEWWIDSSFPGAPREDYDGPLEAELNFNNNEVLTRSVFKTEPLTIQYELVVDMNLESYWRETSAQDVVVKVFCDTIYYGRLCKIEQCEIKEHSPEGYKVKVCSKVYSRISEKELVERAGGLAVQPQLQRWFTSSISNN